MDPTSLSVAEIARGLRAGRLRAADLAEAVIAARAAGRDDPGPYQTFAPDRVRAEAALADAAVRSGRDTGPLMGVPVSVKDLFGVPGYPTFAGTPRALPEAWSRPGPVVQALLRNLAVITGKTHTVELAFGGIGANAHWGTPANPHDPARVPGGSSSGAATSLAEGSAWIGLGTDTAGSLRIPAAWTGQVGVKTTAGRWSTDGIVPLSSTLDTVGVLARTVADARWAMAALDPARPDPEGPIPAPRQLRIGVLGGPLEDGASPGVLEALQDGLRRVEAAGVTVVDAALPEVGPALSMFARGTVAAVELWAFLNRALPDRIESLEPRTRDRVQSAEEMSAREYLDRRAEIGRLQAAARRGFEGYDALVCSTVVETPPRAADLEDVDAYREANLLALRNTSIANTLGLCAVSLPCGTDAAGMPVGCMLMGPPDADARLVAVAAALEAPLRIAARA